MGWKQIPTGPFDLSGDSDPTLAGDLNTNGHAILLAEDPVSYTHLRAHET